MDARILRRLELIDAPRRKARLGKKKGSVSAAINVTPLVDVVLVLLIIFMVVTPLLQGDVDLPQVVEPLEWDTSADDVRVSIDRNGQLAINRAPVGADALRMQLGRELSRAPGRAVFLEADQTLPFAAARAVLESLRDAGASSVGLATLPRHEEGEP